MGAIASALLIGAVYLPVTLTLSVVASVVAAIPALTYEKSVGYCIAIAAVAAALSMIISGRFFYVLPFAVFFAPYIIAKVYVDKSRLSAPFKWLIKYAVLEIALGLLVLLTYLFFSESWEHYTSLGWFLWVFLLVPQAALVPYDLILGGGLRYLSSLIKKETETALLPPKKIKSVPLGRFFAFRLLFRWQRQNCCLDLWSDSRPCSGFRKDCSTR